MSAPDLPTYPLTPEGVTEALEALGHNPEDIAASLKTFEVKGQVSNYLRKVLPPFEAIYVWSHDVRIESSRIEGGFYEPIVVTAYCTPAMGAFIE